MVGFLSDFTSFAGQGRFVVVISLFLICVILYDIMQNRGRNRQVYNYSIVLLCVAFGLLVVMCIMALLFLAGLRPGEMVEALGNAHIVLVLAIIANVTARRNTKKTEEKMFEEICDFLSKKKPKYLPLKNKTCGAVLEINGNTLQAWYGVDFLQVEKAGDGEYMVVVKQKRYDTFRQCDRIREARKLVKTQEEAIKFIYNRFSGGKETAL